jgi:hypothetical protein
LSALSVLSVVALFAAPAHAELLITINKSAQKMTVAVDGATRYVWPVSTGAPGYDTPSGQFKPFRMEEDHFSKEWDDAPMPHSIFFTMQGHAIHGSSHVRAIGTPASHGCVRLEPKNATILYALVKREKMANTRVELIGETPTTTGVPVARHEPAQRRYDNNYQRSTSNDDIDTDYTAAIVQQRQRTVPTRDDDDAQRYYDQDSPDYRQRRYGYEQQQFFGWPFGR